MPTKDDEVFELPERARSTPTEFLIREHMRQAGCHNWTWAKFLRLARAINETPEELGARICLSRGELSRRRAKGRFTGCEGLLLQLHWRLIEAVNTGQPTDGNLFYPIGR